MLNLVKQSLSKELDQFPTAPKASSKKDKTSVVSSNVLKNLPELPKVTCNPESFKLAIEGLNEDYQSIPSVNEKKPSQSSSAEKSNRSGLPADHPFYGFPVLGKQSDHQDEWLDELCSPHLAKKPKEKPSQSSSSQSIKPNSNGSSKELNNQSAVQLAIKDLDEDYQPSQRSNIEKSKDKSSRSESLALQYDDETIDSLHSANGAESEGTEDSQSAIGDLPENIYFSEDIISGSSNFEEGTSSIENNSAIFSYRDDIGADEDSLSESDGGNFDAAESDIDDTFFPSTNLPYADRPSHLLPITPKDITILQDLLLTVNSEEEKAQKGNLTTILTKDAKTISNQCGFSAECAEYLTSVRPALPKLKGSQKELNDGLGAHIKEHINNMKFFLEGVVQKQQKESACPPKAKPLSDPAQVQPILEKLKKQIADLPEKINPFVERSQFLIGFIKKEKEESLSMVELNECISIYSSNFRENIKKFSKAGIAFTKSKVLTFLKMHFYETQHPTSLKEIRDQIDACTKVVNLPANYNTEVKKLVEQIKKLPAHLKEDLHKEEITLLPVLIGPEQLTKLQNYFQLLQF